MLLLFATFGNGIEIRERSRHSLRTSIDIGRGDSKGDEDVVGKEPTEISKNIRPGKPTPSDPKDGDGDVFDYMSKGMTKEGSLRNPKKEHGEDGKRRPTTGLNSMLSTVWNMGFGDPSKWGEYGDPDHATDGGDASSGGGGESSSPEDLEKRCLALFESGDVEVPDDVADAIAAAEADKMMSDEDDEPPSRAHSVTVLAVLLLVMFLLLLLAERGFQWFHDHVVDERRRDFTVLRLKIVLDSAARELTVLAFVLLVGYMVLWSGVIGYVETEWLGYGESEEHLLTTLFGDVHFMLTSAMLVFMLLTVILVLLGERSCRGWSTSESRAAERPHAIVEAYAKKLGNVFGGSTERHELDFLTLRMEFAPMLYRLGDPSSSSSASRPTKLNCDETTSRFAHFDFAEYLSVRLGRELAKILSVGFKSWVLIEVFMLLLTLPLLSTWKVQVACFGLFGYVALALHYAVKLKLNGVWSTLVRRSLTQRVLNKSLRSIRKEDKNFWKTSGEKNDKVRTKSADLLNRMMHNSVRSTTDRAILDLYWRSCGKERQGYERALLLQGMLRLVVVFTAISIILTSLAAGIAYNNDATAATIAIVFFGYLPAVLVLYQIRGVMEKYVVLTSVGPFRRPKVLQHIVDENRHRFGTSVSYLMDWIVLASTMHSLNKNATKKRHCALERVKVDDVLMRSFWKSVSYDKKVKKGDFVRWYQRYKVSCAKSSDTRRAVEMLFDLVANGTDTIDEETFTNMVRTRDQIEMEILYNPNPGNEEGDWKRGKAVRHLASLVHGDDAMTSTISLKNLRTRVKEVTKSVMRDMPLYLFPIFREAGGGIIGSKASLARPVEITKIVALILKYSPTSRNLASGMRG